MIHPIHLLGSSSLRNPTIPVEHDSPALQELIADLLETMHGARGIGLAAPQIGRSERVFIVDVTSMKADIEESGLIMPDQPMIFINPKMVSEYGEEDDFEEACLSIPDIQEIVVRMDKIKLSYLDSHFNSHTENFAGILARVIQHEYDHVEGVLFLDHLSAFKRRLLKRKLNDIKAGITEAEYPVFTDELGVIYPEYEEDDSDQKVVG
ncbi:MAG: peptide deformylase [Bacteroidetes bacterium]|nr:peptide deformylase [Bacteroidota bacterium]